MTEEKSRTATLTELSLLLAVLFLGANPVAVKVAVSEIPPLPFVAMRFTVAGLLLLTLVALLEPEDRLARQGVLSMTGVGRIGVGANNVAFSLGLSMTTASETALIYAAVPIWGILQGLALGLERRSRADIVGVCVTFLGVGVVVLAGLTAYRVSCTVFVQAADKLETGFERHNTIRSASIGWCLR